MLSGIASYIWGAAPTEEEQSPVNESSATSPENQRQLDTQENHLSEEQAEDSDWVLVDKPAIGAAVHNRGCKDTSCSGTPSDSDTDSWAVTPPPCFTASGHQLSRLETSSMENLLIEHPSMSVYAPRGRQCSSGVDSDQSPESGAMETDAPSRRPNTAPHHMSLRHAPRKPRAVAQRAGLLQQVQSVRFVQQAQQRQSNKKISRNQLARTNKLQDCHSRGKTRRRQINQPQCCSQRQRNC